MSVAPVHSCSQAGRSHRLHWHSTRYGWEPYGLEISRLSPEELPEGSGLCTHTSGSQQLPARCRHHGALGPDVPRSASVLTVYGKSFAVVRVSSLVTVLVSLRSLSRYYACLKRK